ncbi:hypothetical protein ZIOFF_067694 [Zingiber officinale]|uniref:Protein kinase domain-containing protein n=1 Tax=Zingiber officinale TaxID=94328 RepID=A0A8J5ER99_ZINOF|nr:hypothetical protein ZIOFF_067694 [Zingiber officinale]
MRMVPAMTSSLEVDGDEEEPISGSRARWCFPDLGRGQPSMAGLSRGVGETALLRGGDGRTTDRPAAVDQVECEAPANLEHGYEIREKEKDAPKNKLRRRDETWTKSVSRGQKRSMLVELSNDEQEDNEEHIPILGLPTQYTYPELEEATNNFQTLIGSGGFECVYKGQFPDKSLAAVKQINASNTQQGEPQAAAGLRDMNRGSLDRTLFGRSSGLAVLKWKQRLDITVGTAHGLAYLHAGCEHRIIHCDMKLENILIHDHNQDKIADWPSL